MKSNYPEKKWSPDQCKQFVRAWKNPDLSQNDVCIWLKLTMNAARGVARRLGASNPRPDYSKQDKVATVERPCMVCGVTIKSEGFHHRMCYNCRQNT